MFIKILFGLAYNLRLSKCISQSIKFQILAIYCKNEKKKTEACFIKYLLFYMVLPRIFGFLLHKIFLLFLSGASVSKQQEQIREEAPREPARSTGR